MRIVLAIFCMIFLTGNIASGSTSNAVVPAAGVRNTKEKIAIYGVTSVGLVLLATIPVITIGQLLVHTSYAPFPHSSLEEFQSLQRNLTSAGAFPSVAHCHVEGGPTGTSFDQWFGGARAGRTDQEEDRNLWEPLSDTARYLGYVVASSAGLIGILRGGEWPLTMTRTTAKRLFLQGSIAALPLLGEPTIVNGAKTVEKVCRNWVFSLKFQEFLRNSIQGLPTIGLGYTTALAGPDAAYSDPSGHSFVITLLFRGTESLIRMALATKGVVLTRSQSFTLTLTVLALALTTSVGLRVWGSGDHYPTNALLGWLYANILTEFSNGGIELMGYYNLWGAKSPYRSTVTVEDVTNEFAGSPATELELDVL